jgi:hypothetical protein
VAFVNLHSVLCGKKFYEPQGTQRLSQGAPGKADFFKVIKKSYKRIEYFNSTPRWY